MRFSKRGDNTAAICSKLRAAMVRYIKRRQRQKMTLPDVGLREVLYEFAKVGRHLRVTALDPRTRIEIYMIADPRYGETLIKRLAARKLAYVIGKKRGYSKRSIDDDDESQSGWDM